MNRSSFPVFQCWRVVLALCALAPLGVSPACAQRGKPELGNSKGGLESLIARIHDSNVRVLMEAAIARYGFIRNVIVSPDGSKLLFVAFKSPVQRPLEDGKSYSYRELFIAGVELVNGLPKAIALPRDMVNADIFKPYYGGGFSGDGHLFAVAQTDGAERYAPWRSVAVFDTRTWKVVRVLPPQSNSIASLAFSRDGTRLLVGTVIGGVAIYRVADGQKLTQWYHYNTIKTVQVGWANIQGRERAVAVTLNTQSVGADTPEPLAQQIREAAQLWDIESNEPIASFPEIADARSAMINWDGSKIAIGDAGLTFSGWDPTSARVAIAAWPDGLPLVSYQMTPVNQVNAGAVSLVWTPDEQNLIAFGVGSAQDNFFRVIAPNPKILSKP